MIKMRLLALVLLACHLAVAWSGLVAQNNAEQALLARTNGTVLVPGPNDPLIAKVTARMLERQHYLRKPFNDEVSSKFLDRYLDSLDSQHIYFLQSDLKEFEKYRTTLDELTIADGDTSPARVIFTRFLERLGQQYEYATNVLEKEKFEFTDDSKFGLNRKTAPRPKDLE